MSPTERTRPMHYFDKECSSSERGDTRGRSKRERPSHNRSDSEAARYLAQFNSGSRSSSKQRESRPSTAGEDAVPGLSFTPTSPTFASVPYTPSIATSYRPARKNRYSSSFASHTEELVTPIMQDHEASSLSTITEKSAKASSVPILSISPPSGVGRPPQGPLSAGRIPHGPLSYEKRKTVPDNSPRQGSLKQLLHFEEMKLGASGG